tara:strand:- start:1207 stop:1704 length:498 start_codon:yes stop_codon:yes gene_type:complete
MKKYLEETLKTQLKDFRAYESSIENEWGGKKRLFKCVDVQLEIKFCKAQMLFDESLRNAKTDKKIEMIEMMYRAYNALVTKAKESGYEKLLTDYKCYQYNKEKIAIVCDLDLQLSNLKSIHGKDKDVILFSMEELFRFVHPDYMKAKEIFKKRDMDITFKRVTYK